MVKGEQIMINLRIILIIAILLFTACDKQVSDVEAYRKAAEEWIEANPLSNDGRDGWSEDAKIKEMVPVYNKNDEINTYIALVEENGEKKGYITFEENHGKIEVPLYSTDGPFYLFTSEYYNPSENLKIVGDAPYGFAFKKENGDLIDPETGETIQK